MKQLFVIAGGNGSGKSTFYKLYLEEKGIPLVNADTLAKTLNPKDSESLSYEASILTLELVGNLLEEGVSFCYETVFSHPSKYLYMDRAKKLGYEVNLIYIHLSTPILNEARVSQRVSEGGHPVPVDKIYSRIPRTMKHIRIAIQIADKTLLIDNSSASDPFRQVGYVERGQLKEVDEDNQNWVADLFI